MLFRSDRVGKAKYRPGLFDEAGEGRIELENGLFLGGLAGEKRFEKAREQTRQRDADFINTILRSVGDENDDLFTAQLLEDGIAGFKARTPGGQHYRRSQRSIAESAVTAFGGDVEKVLGKGRRFKEDEQESFGEFLAFASELEETLGTLNGTWTEVDGQLKALDQQYLETMSSAEKFGMSVDEIKEAFETAEANITADFEMGLNKSLIGDQNKMLFDIIEFETNVAQERLRVAETLGADMLLVEEANAADRQRIIDAALAPIRNAQDQIDTGTAGGLSPLDRYANSVTKFNDAIQSGDASAVAEAGLGLLDISRFVNASGAGFAADKSFVEQAFEEFSIDAGDASLPFAGLIEATDNSKTAIVEELERIRLAIEEQSSAIEDQDIQSVVNPGGN